MVAGAVLAAADTAPGPVQQSLLAGRGVLPALSFRAGSPPSGAFLTADNLKTAAANGVLPPASGPFFASQPIQGISGLVPAGDGAWWALADNGYGNRETSADWQLAIYRLGSAAGTNRTSLVALSPVDTKIRLLSLDLWTLTLKPSSSVSS